MRSFYSTQSSCILRSQYRTSSHLLFSHGSKHRLQLSTNASNLKTPLQQVKPPRTRRRFLKATLYSGSLLGALYLYDNTYNYSIYTRGVRAAVTLSTIAIDNWFHKDLEDGDPRLSALLERVAGRMSNLILENGGIYMKIGQAIALNARMMPAEFRVKFQRFFDDAPTVGLDEIERVLREEYGITDPNVNVLDTIFSPGSFEPEAVGSASIAQVHRARLRETGERVAVKVQKPAIKWQIGWDLWAIRTMVRIMSGSKNYGEVFGTVTEFIAERLFSETDFVNEASNSEKTRQFISQEPGLRDSTYVPKIFPEYSTKRVLVAEWIDGVSIAQKEILTGLWKGEEYVGKPLLQSEVSPHASDGQSEEVYGLGLQPKEIMNSVMNLFSAQIFKSGNIHCDPHPGNILVRRLPSGVAQLVLLDHGLYMEVTPKFRHLYAQLWDGILRFDKESIVHVAQEWGIGNADMLSRMSSMRGPPRHGFRRGSKASDREAEKAPKTDKDESGPPGFPSRREGKRPNMEDFFTDQKKLPKELFFIFRIMRTLNGTNDIFNEPVSQIKIIGAWASSTLSSNAAQQHRTWSTWFTSAMSNLRYSMVMLVFECVRLSRRVKNAWNPSNSRERAGRLGDMNDERELGAAAA
ncbi:MAG: hypothetical protein M1834_002814 [Cirrosporium novae-zelandiae]|nr:MAG: hypothetical protein M1834_002814 [Cirrosporium novae-zelandiae]